MSKIAKIQYYTDEVNDDFGNFNKKPYKLPENYIYINKNLLWRFAGFIVYRLIMTPVAFITSKVSLHAKFVNRKVLRPYRNKGYFLYGNHTHIPCDAYIPNVISFPTNNYVLVHTDNVSTFGTQNLMKMIGAMPLPSTTNGARNFIAAVEKRLVQHNCVTIFPEAHVWPYYTGIRPFKSVSFKYPVKFKDPTFCFTTTYQKRRFGKKPRATVYVDGPFFPDTNLTPKEQQEMLRNMVYDTMIERSKNSTYEYVHYEKKTQ